MKEFESKWGSGSQNVHIVEKGGGETPRIYMQRVQETFCGSDGSFFGKYLELETACTDATQKYNALRDGCKARDKAYKDKIEECDNIQMQMDGAACNRAILVKDACESYAECFNSKRVAFLNSKSMVAKAEIDRKEEW